MAKGKLVKQGYVPNQHGAWAMLVIPFLLGMFAAKAGWLHALLFVGWLLVYLFTFPFLQGIRTGKWKVYGKPLLFYGCMLAPVGAGLLLLHPELLKMVPWFIPLFIVNVYYAKRNRERALVNDLAAILQFSLMVFVAYEVGGGTDLRLAAELFALNAIYFIGTIFYVKTIIRERNNKRYYWYSVSYHVAACAIGAIWFPPLLLLALAVLLVRSVWAPRTGITAKKSGMMEIGYSVLVTCTALTAYLW